jgi:hypothetical protein
MKYIKTVFFVLMVSGTYHGCTSQPKRVIQAPVPAGMGREDVELAILLATGLELPKQGHEKWKDVKESALKSSALQRVSGVDDHDEDKWVYETFTPTTIYASYADGKEVLRARIDYTTSSVNIRVDGSDNLNETQTNIHRSANEWLDDLKLRINRALGKVQLLKKMYN